jgi:uncharacterized protein YqhQ
MNYGRQFVRLFLATQLLPVIENGEETTLVGGQAVLEGVMMRSPHAWAISVRKPSGGIATHSEPLPRPSDRHRWMRWPVLRGIVTLGHAMALGFRALKYSANVALEGLAGQSQGGHEQESVAADAKPLQIPGWLLALNVLFSLAFLIFMYKFVPLVAATALRRVSPAFGNQVVFALTDGAIRIAIFLGFLWLLSQFKDIHRMFEYHGAEHKTVFCFEAGDNLEIPEAQKFVTFHPRCGTSFLMTVMLICIAVYAAIPGHIAAGHGLMGIFDRMFWMRFGLRIALLPLIVGVSYEIIRYAARHRSSLFAAMTQPGLWLQRITTKPPADNQVECAISALQHAMDIEKVNGGELVIA